MGSGPCCGWKHLAIIACVCAVVAAIVAVVVGVVVPCGKDSKDSAYTVSHSETSLGRLPQHIQPLHQLVELQPHIYSGQPPFPVDGRVEVRLEVQARTDIIYLKTVGHDIVQGSVDLQLGADSPVQAAPPTLSRWDVDRTLEFFKVFVDGYLEEGAHYVLKFNFTSFLNEDVGGFYSDLYVQDGTVRYLASTQHQRLGWARQTFPGWDEPGFKVKYDIVIVRQVGWTALSNMPIESSEDRGGGWVADRFKTTPLMSAYIVCVTVFQFEYRELTSSHGHVVRVWSRPDLINSTSYGLQMAAGMLDYFEDWTEVAYPLPKMDIMALPSRPGAMENWGLMSYAEYNLLYDPNYHDLSRLLTVARIMGHELAHQWFGNLVTCRWWDDIWLNEAFASYFENLPLDDVAGLPGMEVHLLRMKSVLYSDARTTSTPIRNLVATPQDAASIFVTYVYSKGSSIVKTIHTVLGDQTFRKAIKRYLDRHAYSAVITEDLWTALTEQAEEDGVTDVDGLKLFLKEKFDPWVDQRGFPLLTLSARQQAGQAAVTQTPFVNLGDDVPPSAFNNEWYIPINIQSEGDSTSSNTTVEWLNRQNKTIQAGLPGDLSKWYILNVQRTGFYRVQYDAPTKAQIEQQLLVDHTVFDVQNRALFIDDGFHLVRSGRGLDVSAMNMTRHIDKEDGYIMWWIYDSSLKFMAGLLPRIQTSFEKLQLYTRTKVGPVYDRLGWTDGSDGSWKRMARSMVVSIACSANYQACVDQARVEFDLFKQTSSPNPIPPDRRVAVYCTSLAHGDESDWDALYNLYNSTIAGSFTAENLYWRNAVLTALACPTNRTVLQKYLEYIENSYHVRDDDVEDAITALAASNHGRQVVWEHLNSTWRLPTRFPNSSVFQTVTSGLASDDDVIDLTMFMDLYKPQDVEEETLYAEANHTVGDNNAWTQQNVNDLNSWFDLWT